LKLLADRELIGFHFAELRLLALHLLRDAEQGLNVTRNSAQARSPISMS
jgi:hypothetical protein